MHIAAGILGLAAAAYALMLAVLATLGASMGMVADDFGNHVFGPKMNAQMNMMMTPPGMPTTEEIGAIGGLMGLIGIVMLVWGAAAFAKPSRAWCTAFLVFAIATIPAGFLLFGGPDLLMTVPACASALFALSAAKAERAFTPHQRERISPSIGNNFKL